MSSVQNVTMNDIKIPLELLKEFRKAFDKKSIRNSTKNSTKNSTRILLEIPPESSLGIRSGMSSKNPLNNSTEIQPEALDQFNCIVAHQLIPEKKILTICRICMNSITRLNSGASTQVSIFDVPKSRSSKNGTHSLGPSHCWKSICPATTVKGISRAFCIHTATLEAKVSFLPVGMDRTEPTSSTVGGRLVLSRCAHLFVQNLRD